LDLFVQTRLNGQFVAYLLFIYLKLCPPELKSEGDYSTTNLISLI